jgi:hypothetical protein
MNNSSRSRALQMIFGALTLLSIVSALVLVRPPRIIAEPTRSDLERRVSQLEIDATITGQHVQALESKVRSLEAGDEDQPRRSDRDNQASNVTWLIQALSANTTEIDSLDKRVRRLEYDSFVETVCAEAMARKGTTQDRKLCATLKAGQAH